MYHELYSHFDFVRKNSKFLILKENRKHFYIVLVCKYNFLPISIRQ